MKTNQMIEMILEAKKKERANFFTNSRNNWEIRGVDSCSTIRTTYNG